jgi:hypothetical protein
LLLRACSKVTIIIIKIITKSEVPGTMEFDKPAVATVLKKDSPAAK